MKDFVDVQDCYFPSFNNTNVCILPGVSCSPTVTKAQDVLVNNEPSIDNVTSVSVDMSNKESIELRTLHRILDHAFSPIIKKVISLYKPKLSINKDFIFYDACQYGKSHMLM